ncbi:ATP-dependent DNA helicase RecG [Tessaracoccus caeni]|uniref:ATP-dependent DNA helicase RecG n=1 Tax=Tessaracoccus caeni TaxID=3031239 RepID=UPI0023DBB92B|nr:ATP-dependent DNA helicase RecG [Tessaracoccus caeni]MDF1490272.1 ATP-dependent DNA helicase RecG [Tessaracoccus caeni]
MWRTPIYRELNRRLPDVVGAKTATELRKLGLETVDDLVRHVPRRYIAGTEMSSFADLEVGEDVAVVAKVRGVTVRHGRATRVEAVITDGDRNLGVTFFAPKKYLVEAFVKALKPGERGIFIGRVGTFQQDLQLTHPKFVMLDGPHVRGKKAADRQVMGRQVQRAGLVGIYPATSTLPTWNVAEAIELVLPGLRHLGDTLPTWVVQAAGVPSLQTALTAVHEPTDAREAEEGIERLRFDEAFGIQLAMARRRAEQAKEPATPRRRTVGGILDAFDERLPFPLTRGQVAVGEEIFQELAGSSPMHRLLQGDVGSGKTIVALRAMLAVVDSGGQAVLLAPTEVLAKQHHATITALLGDLADGGTLGAHPSATSVALLTGSGSAAAKRDAMNRIVTGEAGIVVGTHALLSDPVEFFDLGLVVIDEQHRFGVEQRAALSAKARQRPHTLIMTATPIPRSIAMTVFGDLDVSELRERPGGRAEVQTVPVNTVTHPAWVERAWSRIREEVAQGRQAFVVCPAISGKQLEVGMEPGADRTPTAVTELYEQLSGGALAGLRVGMAHGKLPTAERDETMARFAAGELDVLVATTVIEVGVDVPNASVMVVVDADRFGISQLHQLRGRIGRGQWPGLCLLLAPMKEEEDSVAAQRLRALAASTDGFELAEQDLVLRREGDVLGAAQSGGSSLKLLRVLDDEAMIGAAKQLAERVLADSRATEDPLLADLVTQAELWGSEWAEKN